MLFLFPLYEINHKNRGWWLKMHEQIEVFGCVLLFLVENVVKYVALRALKLLILYFFNILIYFYF